MIGFSIMLPMHMQNITRSASMSGAGMSGGYSSMALNISMLIVSIGFFIFVIAIAIGPFLDAWGKISCIFKIPHVRKSETSETPETPDPSQDTPAYLVGVRLDAMQRDIDQLHCKLKALESRINNGRIDK